MRMFRSQLLMIFIIFVRDSSCVINALYNIGKKLWNLNSLIDRADLNLMRGPKGFAENSPNQELRDHIHRIHAQVRAMEYSEKPNMIDSLMRMMKSKVLVIKCLDIMGLFIASIDDDYEKFNNHVFNGELEKLEAYIIPNIQSKIQMIQKLMIDTGELLPNDRNLINAITGYVMTKNLEICGGPQLFTEGIIHLFRIAILAEIKTLVIISVANKYKYLKDEGWKSINYIARRGFQKYFGTYVVVLKVNLNLMEGSYLRACDPQNWIMNENFYELENTATSVFFQYNSELCWSETCESIWHRKWYHSCDVKELNERRGCSNPSTECTNLGTVKACLLKNDPDIFQYINSTELGLLGKNFDCPNNGYIIDDPEYHTCSCNCYREHNRISLRIIESSWHLNMVITGLRFLRKNNILYIQPKQGTLMANGYIDPNSETWINIPYGIPLIEPSQFPFINGSNKYFFLDDVRLPEYYVLTGVQFQNFTRASQLGFGIKVSGTLFHYATGQLDLSETVEKFIDTDVPRRTLVFESINPIQGKLHQTVSTEAKYVALTPSDIINNFQQSTLPLFDAVPVTINQSSPLGGVGIFHKGAKGYAGFISLRLFGIRYKEYFLDFIDDEMVADLVLFN